MQEKEDGGQSVGCVYVSPSLPLPFFIFFVSPSLPPPPSLSLPPARTPLPPQLDTVHEALLLGDQLQSAANTKGEEEEDDGENSTHAEWAP